MMQDIIKGDLALTLKVKAGNIYPIEYDSASGVNIINYTDGSIFVSEQTDFEYNDKGVGNFLVITDGNSYNEYLFYKSGKNTIYIKTDADGQVCIIRKQW